MNRHGPTWAGHAAAMCRAELTSQSPSPAAKQWSEQCVVAPGDGGGARLRRPAMRRFVAALFCSSVAPGAEAEAAAEASDAAVTSRKNISLARSFRYRKIPGGHLLRAPLRT